MRKKLLSLALVTALALAPTSMVFASEVDTTPALSVTNESSTEEYQVSTTGGKQRALIHKGTLHYTSGWAYHVTSTYSGTAYKLSARVYATYSNGLGKGPDSTRKNLYNTSSITTPTIYETNAKRQFFGQSWAQNTSSSAEEYTAAQSGIWD